jgi:hypothetical protein
MSEELIARWLDDRASLSDDDAAELERALSADPALAQQVKDQLATDELLSRRLAVDRRNFENQVAQRIVGKDSEVRFVKSTLDAVGQESRRRSAWRSRLPEAAAAAVLVAALLVVLLRNESTPTPTAAPGAAARQGLRAQYYRDQSLKGTPSERIDSVVDFTWPRGNAPIATSRDVYSIRWTGKITPKYGERYTFHTKNDDGVRVWVDGKPVISDWIGRYSIADNRGEITLEAGRAYDLKIEYFNGGDIGVLRLFWSSPSQPEEIVPESALSH